MDPVSICNLALGWLGASPITTLEDPSLSVEAQLCAANYEPTVRAVLEERAWTFATQRLDLGAGQESGIAELPRRFVLPTTVVRVLACDDGSGDFSLEWAREGQAIVAGDTDKVIAKAIVLVTDPGLWTQNFVLAVAYKLASILAVPISQSRPLQADMLAMYERHLRAAGTLDGMQGRAERTRTVSSLAARRL